MTAPFIKEINDLGTSIELKDTASHYYIVGKGHLVDIIKNKGKVILTISADAGNLYNQNQFEIDATTTYNGDTFATVDELVKLYLGLLVEPPGVDLLLV